MSFTIASVLVAALGAWHTCGMTKKKPSKPKKPVTRKSREDANQIAFRVMQEVIRKSES